MRAEPFGLLRWIVQPRQLLFAMLFMAMAFKTAGASIPVFAGLFKSQRNSRSNIVPIAGDRAFSRLINAVQSQYVTLTFRGTLTIAGAVADNVRNRGSILAAFDEIGIDENGTDKHIYDGRVLRFISEMAAPSALSAKRLTSTAIAATTLEESVRIYFAHPFAVLPRETQYLERDTKQLFQVFAKLNSGGGGSRLAGVTGASTAVLSAVTITVTQGYDASETARPFFIPIVRQQIAPVASANAQLTEFIKTSNAIRGIVVSQESTQGVNTGLAGEVGDVINKLTLRGDFHDIIGPTPVKWDDLVLEQEYEFGGAVVTSNRAHLGINFQEHGRLATVLNPGQDSNLRFEFDVQPSVTMVAGTTSQIRITIMELLRDPTVVEPTLPIPV